MSLDISNNLFLIDTKHFYRFQCNTKETTVYRNTNCVGIYGVDDKFCYALSHGYANK